MRSRALPLALLLAACGNNPTTTPPIEVDPPPADIELGVLPDSATGRRLAWVIRELNRGGPSAEQIERNFTRELLAGFSAPDLARALATLSRQIAPLNVDRVVGQAEERRVTAAVLSRGADWYTLKVTTAAEEPHLIAGIFYEADPSLARPPPADWTSFETEVLGIAPTISYLAAELTTDQCRTIAENESTSSRPIGSAFKLYVLASLVEEVRAARLAWDELLAIEDAYKSFPSGTFHLLAAGSTLAVSQYAQAMIAASDNTATDHLIKRVGRSTVEAMMERAGHHEPSRNRPLMTTREFFLLKLFATTDAREAYVSGDETARRSYLETELASIDLFQLETQYREWTTPRELDRIEWFASNEDLCRVMIKLRDEMQTPEGAPLGEILSENTVVDFSRRKWAFAGFKGGSEPGLLQVTWLLQRVDQRWFLISITAVDPDRPVAQGSVVLSARAAFELLDDEP